MLGGEKEMGEHVVCKVYSTALDIHKGDLFANVADHDNATLKEYGSLRESEGTLGHVVALLVAHAISMFRVYEWIGRARSLMLDNLIKVLPKPWFNDVAIVLCGGESVLQTTSFAYVAGI